MGILLEKRDNCSYNSVIVWGDGTDICMYDLRSENGDYNNDMLTINYCNKCYTLDTFLKHLMVDDTHKILRLRSMRYGLIEQNKEFLITFVKSILVKMRAVRKIIFLSQHIEAWEDATPGICHRFKLQVPEGPVVDIEAGTCEQRHLSCDCCSCEVCSTTYVSETDSD